MDAGEKILAIIYRVYYKVMKTKISPKALIISLRDETLLFEANLKHKTIRLPKE